jgi:hypothetical protein
MTGADETANLVGQLTQGYREHKAEDAGPEIAAVSGRVIGSDIEDQADALADAAERLAELLTAFTREPHRSLEPIAVFRRLSRSAAAMVTAAEELRRQEWFDLEDDQDPEAAAAWDAALAGLRSAESTFKWVAEGWI